MPQSYLGQCFRCDRVGNCPPPGSCLPHADPPLPLLPAPRRPARPQKLLRSRERRTRENRAAGIAAASLTAAARPEL